MAAVSAPAYARYVEPFWPALERVPMDFPDLTLALQGLRVLQLSDLHVASQSSLDYIRRQVARCQDLAPDVVVYTGDFITLGSSHWIDQLASVLCSLRGRYGTFAVLGNHDFGVYGPRRRPRGPDVAERMAGVLSDCGIAVLRNQCHVLTVQGAALQLVGIEDFWSGYCDPAEAFAQADPALPTVALTHNPDTMPRLEPYPCRWVLCGHTHGGQVRVPFFGAPVLPISTRYDAGLFHVGPQRLYVNRGLGYLIQVRFDCRPEITEFTLTTSTA